MRMIDLCCGIGGIRRGFEFAGEFENVLSAEKDNMPVGLMSICLAIMQKMM